MNIVEMDEVVWSHQFVIISLKSISYELISELEKEDYQVRIFCTCLMVN